MSRKRRVALWDAINEYAASCGADTSTGVYGNTRRQAAVSAVECAVDLELAEDNRRKFQLLRERDLLEEKLEVSEACRANQELEIRRLGKLCAEYAIQLDEASAAHPERKGR